MRVSYVQPEENGAVEWPELERDGLPRAAVVTIGTFDGVHRGHRVVLDRVLQEARKRGARSVVVLFDPRPAIVHRYAACHEGAQIPDAAADAVTRATAVTSVSQRLRLLESCGIDEAIVVTYSLAFARQAYDFFLLRLADRIGMRALVLGDGARLGRGRAGTIDAIGELAQRTGAFDLDVVAHHGPGFVSVPVDDGMVASGEAAPDASRTRRVRMWSSSTVRALLRAGRVSEASRILGRLHCVEGEVVHGEQRGRALGFPTANLGGDIQGLMPCEGVYSGWLVDCGPRDDAAPAALAASDERTPGKAPYGEKRYPTAVSIGTKETFEDDGVARERLLEANVVGHGDWLDLYGHHIRIEFLQRLRGQVKFDGVGSLVEQMRRDALETQEQCRLARCADAR